MGDHSLFGVIPTRRFQPLFRDDEELYLRACNLNSFIAVACDDSQFYKGQWQMKDGHYLYREYMAKDLRKSFLHKEVTCGEVVNMLGGDYSPDSLAMTYEIAVGYFGVDQVRIENLTVEFTTDSLVRTFRLTKGKKGKKKKTIFLIEYSE